MTTRLPAILAILTLLVLGTAPRLIAHAGHDHKVMGTVTMAMADHIMVKDTNGKDVTIRVAKTTKVKATPALKVEEIKNGTRVVITASMEKDVMTAKEIQVGAAPAAPVTPK
jgi:hypothetical protein